MSRKILIVIWLLMVPWPVNAQWIESYYECLCHGGTRETCSAKLEDFPEFQEFMRLYSKSEPNPRLATEQVRRADIFIGERYERLTEERSCLDYIRPTLRKVMIYAIRENSIGGPGAPIRIGGLKELAELLYRWAEEYCFDHSTPPSQPIQTSLPNPDLCKFR